MPRDRQPLLKTVLDEDIKATFNLTDSDTLTRYKTIDKFIKRFSDNCIDIQSLTVHKKIGEGAFSLVFKCKYKEGSKTYTVAVKKLKSKLFGVEQDVYDFFMEAQLLRKLKHPNIVDFIGLCYGNLGKDGDESLCVIQEFMNHGSLKDMILMQMMRPNKTVYTKRQAIKWMIEVSKGLKYLHNLKAVVIHRDLKPENILLTMERGQIDVKLADFGLSSLVPDKNSTFSRSRSDVLNDKNNIMSEDLSIHNRKKKFHNKSKSNPKDLLKSLSGISDVMNSSSNEASTNDSLLSESNLASPSLNDIYSNYSTKPLFGNLHNLTGRTGSLMYMAPEVLRCQRYNEKVDVFSFGIVLYEVLRAVRLIIYIAPNGKMSEVETYANRVADGLRPPIPEIWPDDLRNLVEKCWAPSPHARPSMKEVSRRLQAMYANGVFDEPSGKHQRKCNLCNIQ